MKNLLTSKHLASPGLTMEITGFKKLKLDDKFFLKMFLNICFAEHLETKTQVHHWQKTAGEGKEVGTSVRVFECVSCVHCLLTVSYKWVHVDL